MTNAEREVADFLKEMEIKWSYEHPLFVWDEDKRPRVWAPDFYLMSFGIYIEVCGSKNFDYEYRRKIFGKNEIRVVFLHLFKDQDMWKKHFIKYLVKIILYRNKKMCKILKNRKSIKMFIN